MGRENRVHTKCTSKNYGQSQTVYRIGPSVTSNIALFYYREEVLIGKHTCMQQHARMKCKNPDLHINCTVIFQADINRPPTHTG